MDDATGHLRALARRIVDEARERAPLRAALLTGSAGRGDADVYSDIDLLLYVDEIPPEKVLGQIREAVGGTDPIPKGEPTEFYNGVEFDLNGVRTEVNFFTVARVDWRLDQLLDKLEEFDSTFQKVLSGLLEGLPLYGDEVVERWQRRLRDYPEPMRRAMVEKHWSFFPLWYYHEAIAVRDAELWRLDILLEAAFNLLGVLAGLNRLYFTRVELKRTRALTRQMTQAPPRLAERLESLFRLEPEEATAELERLVAETRVLVKKEFPDLELPLRHPLGARQRAWRP
jgi:predicted nucleotidyltransferase